MKKWLNRKKINSIDVNNIPHSGGFIVAMSHSHFRERVAALPYIFKLFAHIKKKPMLVTITALRIFHFIIAPFFIPIYLKRRYHPSDIKSLERAIKYLQQGGIVFISPEGKKNQGRLRRGKEGVAYIAICSKAPILPMTIYEDSKENLLLIRFGKIIKLDVEKTDAASLRHATDHIMRQIATILPKKHRGVYA